MRETFIEKNFSSDSRLLLDKVLTVLETYADQGYDLSLRQCYYQLVAGDLLPPAWADPKTGSTNNERSYKNLGSLISDARLAGLIDWDAIKDRGRETVRNSHWANPADIMESCVSSFQIDKWAEQPNYVELMVEKQALEGVLEPVCRSLDIAFTANKGYSSSSAMYETGKRLQARIDEGKAVHIIYLGDHDPSGIDMTRDIDDRLRMFSGQGSDSIELEVHRVALNMNQISRLKPPENPAKITDSRAAAYIERFGRSSWELDAIEPRSLDQIVRSQVDELRDPDLWAEAVKRENAMKAELKKFAKTSKFS